MAIKKSKTKQLGQLLMDKELLTHAQLDQALEIQLKEGGLLGQILIKLGFVTEQQIEDCVFEQTTNSQKLENVLVEMGIVNLDQINQANDLEKKGGGFFAQNIIKLGFLSAEDLVSIMVTQFGFPYLQLENYEIDPEIVKLVPRDIAHKFSLIAIDKIGNILTIAMADPLNAKAQDEIRKVTGLNVETFISTFSEIDAALTKSYK
jgi:type IV pilus assembly protein PilB